MFPDHKKIKPRPGRRCVLSPSPETGPSVVRQVSFTLLLNLIVAIVILLSTRGTAGSDIWYTHLVGRPVVRSYHPRDYA